MSTKINPEDRLNQLGIVLPPACRPAGNYRPAILWEFGNLLFVSGHTPDDARAEGFCTGKVGVDVTIEQAYEGARDVGLAILATVRAHLGSLSRVKRLVRATGVVNSTPDFADHPKVMNGFSDLMAKVFGEENGIGARSATGAISLPGNVSVEVTDCIFEVEIEQ